MKPINKAGFTIVETMLFLGISALLIMGILVGTGASINVQRYRDSVTSLQSFLQQQYSDVSNVSNNRAVNDLPCGSAVNIPVGQSDCVILGRFITPSNNGKTLIIKNIVGHLNPGEKLSSNDVAALKQYNIAVSSEGSATSEYDIEWDSSVVKPGGSTAMDFSILILRSPSSGIIRTFADITQNISDIDIDRLLLSQPLAIKQEVKFCVDSNGMLTGNKMAVIINAGATGASGIETQGEGNGC